ncbi:MAG: YceH family protein [Aquabacterium sp.]|uniref:YceH family protein n=1 Tax=Aquabacterium sp. TaxID=1872578 RepID=UPI003BD14D01
MSLRPLTAEEARVLAVLVEKQHTVPDSYPLSLNALTLGCNQKTARDPVMNLTEAQVLEAVNGLRELSLVSEVSGSRVVRFDHNAARGLGVPSQSVALLTILMLRGPQTAAELRLHSERLHRFADTSSVEAFLDELASKEPPRVVKLPRAPGARESRWAHLLCGEVSIDTPAPMVAADAAGLADEVAQLRAEQTRMAAELADLRALVQRLAAELGMPAADTSNT